MQTSLIFKVQIKVDNAKPSNSSVEVTIPLSSVNTNVVAFDKEFQEEAWFNAAKYPNITFKSTKVETKDKKHFKITGNLTVKGVTKPVVLDAVLNKQGEHPRRKYLRLASMQQQVLTALHLVSVTTCRMLEIRSL